MRTPRDALRNFRKHFARWGATEYALLLVLWGGMSTPLYMNGWGVFSVLSLPLFLGFILCAIYVAHRCIPSAPALGSKRSHIIEISTIVGPVERHGTLSFLNGVPAATWTTHEGGDRVTVEATMTDLTFRNFWNAYRYLHALQQFTTTDEKVELDVRSNHLITVAFTDAGQTYVGNFLIPHVCAVPKVRAWVEQLEASGNFTRPGDRENP